MFTYHVGGGVNLRLAERWYAGVDMRYAFAKVKWFTTGMVSLNGLRFTAAVGTRF